MWCGYLVYLMYTFFTFWVIFALAYLTKKKIECLFKKIMNVFNLFKQENFDSQILSYLMYFKQIFIFLFV